MTWIDQIMQRFGSRLFVQTVEVKLTDTSGTYALPDDTILRDCHLVGIFATANDSDDKKAPSGRTLIGPAAMRNAYLSLKCDNVVVWNNVPLSFLTVAPTDRQIGPIDLKGMTPNSSTIQIADTSTISSGESILLHFFYEK